MNKLFVVMCAAALALSGCITNMARSAMDVSNKAITSLTEKSGNETLKKAGSVAVSTQSTAMDMVDHKGAAKTSAAKDAAAKAPAAPAPVAKTAAKKATPKVQPVKAGAEAAPSTANKTGM